MAKTPDDKKFLAATPNALKDSKNAKVIVGTVNKLAGASVALVDYFEWLGDYDAENYGGNRSRFEKAVVSLIGRKSYDDLDATSRLDSIVDFVFGPKKAKGGKLTVGGMTFKDLDKLIKKRPAADKSAVASDGKKTSGDKNVSGKVYSDSIVAVSSKYIRPRNSALIKKLRDTDYRKAFINALRKVADDKGIKIELVTIKERVLGGTLKSKEEKHMVFTGASAKTRKNANVLFKQAMKQAAAQNKTAAAEKKSVASTKKPSARSIISALKEKGIKAKVVTNAKTGKKTIEIAVVETAE